MSGNLYPDDPAPQAVSSPYVWRLYRPLARAGNPWTQKTRTLTRSSLIAVDLVYRAMSWTKAKVLADFWEAYGYGIFMFADFNGYKRGGTDPGVAWWNLFVGKGTGAQTTWDLPTKSIKASPAPVVQVGGVTKDVTVYPVETGTDAVIWPGGGTNGIDKIVFTTAGKPAADALITIDATCRRVGRICRMAADGFPFATVIDPGNFQGGTVTIVEQRS